MTTNINLNMDEGNKKNNLTFLNHAANNNSSILDNSIPYNHGSKINESKIVGKNDFLNTAAIGSIDMNNFSSN